MSQRAIVPFDVTGWDQSAPEKSGDGPMHSRATVKKAFRGDLEGESRAELLMCQADVSDITAGAGYVASEVVSGTLGGRSGTFVVHHWGVSEGSAGRTGGHIVPGSGTGDLAGITGTVEIDVGADGAHTLTLEYDLP